MKPLGIWIGGLLGGLTALVLAVLGELASSLFGLPGIAFSLFDWMARHLPGPIISLFIGSMVKAITALNLGPTSLVAKRIEQGMAIVVFMAIGVVFGLILTAAARRRPEQLSTWGVWGGAFLLILWLAILVSLSLQSTNILVSILWLGVLFMGWGWLLGQLIAYLAWPAKGSDYDPSRRRFLYLVGAGSFAVLVSAAGVSLAPSRESVPNTGGEPGPETLANASTTSGPAQSPPQSVLSGRFNPVPGTRPELTDNAGFYRIDINTIP